MQDENSDWKQEKPNIYMMERSPLLSKAQCFVKMLEEDQNRIERLKSENKLYEISIEKIDDNDTEVIQMTILPGVLESKNLVYNVTPLDSTEMPPNSWQKATEEPKKE
ncbi:hypothetical protein M9Y10_045653 [Tritrichomonas musculus]|uniref:Uncharacterized protein n=1 Tax=Tritrichomonas musculus TaxID=1915356 RepID=A0ABR2JVU4_9EUKA